MKAIPFINTMLDDQYRVFLLEPFNEQILQTYFDDWFAKDMVGWLKFTNRSNKVSFEFHGEGNHYKIKNPKLVGEKSFTLPYPKNLDQFICDCERCLVTLHWQEDIVTSMDRIVLMDQSEIAEYNKELLIKIDKG